MDASVVPVATGSELSFSVVPSLPRRRPSLSLVLPAFNEQESIEQAIREADAALVELCDDYEILVIDDGSTDQTAQRVSELLCRYQKVRLLRQPRNQGYGAALRRGFAAATKPLVAFTDADCQFDPRELGGLMLLSERYDLVCGYRIQRQDPWIRKFYSHTYNAIARLLLGTRVRDCDCAFKVIRRSVMPELPFEADGFFVNAEMLALARQADLSVVEVGVSHRRRAAGTSTVSPRQILPVGSSLLKFWWQKELFPRSTNLAAADWIRWSSGRESGALLLLILASLLLFFLRMSYPLIEPDETRYAQIALEMVQSGDWITPTLQGEPYLDKPPLLYWVTALGFASCGESEWVARLPSALCAMFTVLTVYGLGRYLVGQRAAWCASLALLLCSGFVLSGRFLIMDGPLTWFVTVSLLAGYLSLQPARPQWRWWVIAATACGLGVLVKGPIAVVLTLPPLLLAGWLNGDLAALRWRHIAVWWAIVALVASPWFVAISLVNSDFLSYFFWRHNVMRFANAFDHQQPWWFYLPVLLIGMFPASVLAGPLVMFLFGRAEEQRSLRTPAHGLLLISGLWTIGFFSLSSCKVATYILPALPPLCLLAGSLLDLNALAGSGQRGISRFLQRIPQPALLSLSGLVIPAAMVHALVLAAGPLAVASDIVVCTLAIALILAVLRAGSQGRPWSWGRSAAVAVGAMAFCFSTIVADVAQRRSIHTEVELVHRENKQLPVVYFGYRTYSASFHLDPSDFVALRPNQLAALGEQLQSNQQIILVTEPKYAGRIRRNFGDSLELAPAGGRGRIFITSRKSSLAGVLPHLKRR